MRTEKEPFGEIWICPGVAPSLTFGNWGAKWLQDLKRTGRLSDLSSRLTNC